MVLTQQNDQVIDIQHIYFIRISSGPILIGVSKAPDRTLAHYEMYHHEPLELLASRPGDRKELQSIRVELAPHHIRSDWFAPSPEVLEYVAGRVPGAGVRCGVRGRKLTQPQVLEVFRLCHETGYGYAMIAARYGINTVSVSKIARGHVYKHLFRVEPAPQGVVPAGLTAAARRDIESAVYISENRHGAPRYRVVPGKRGAK